MNTNTEKKAVFIDGDGNDDWIKTLENRASEAAIHDELARKHGVGE